MRNNRKIFSGFKKYWVIFKNGIQINLTYRFNFFVALAAELLSLIVVAYLWLSIYHQGNKIGSYSLTGLITYYLLTKFIRLSINTGDIGRNVGETIRLGYINNFVNKPLSFLGKNLSQHSSSFVLNLFVYSLILGPILFSYGNLDLTTTRVAIFLLFLLLGFFINFFVFYLIGLTTFYIGFVMGLNYIAFGVSLFFSGNLMPLDLFPPTIATIANWLPFKFIVYVPSQIISGKISGWATLNSLISALIWLFALYAAAKTYYSRGIEKYESYGG